MRIYRDHVEQTGEHQKLLNSILAHIDNVKGHLPNAPIVFVIMNPDDWYFLRDYLVTLPGYGKIHETKELHGNPVIVSSDVPEDNVLCTLYPYHI